MQNEASNFERLGGEAGLRAIIDDFVERIYGDMMIGFFFANANKARLKEKEYEHAARWLGAEVPYTGRPLREAHGKHRIMGGQFMRRRKILEQTLQDHGVERDLIDAWLAHQDGLRAEITGDDTGECIGTPGPGTAARGDDTP